MSVETAAEILGSVSYAVCICKIVCSHNTWLLPCKGNREAKCGGHILVSAASPFLSTIGVPPVSCGEGKEKRA